ncbi:MAG: PQQ-binding-like beta-propeller repeat protein [Euryarchaeota archaeon]|nr:PQQ-binding-like beta-propeller repeat protein [Euryarchaeota archaeon]
MKKITSLFFVFILTLSTVSYIGGPLDGTEITHITNPEKYENGYRYNIQGWIYLHIEGKPYDRGYQHGYLLADEIADHITRWSNIIHNSAKNSKKPVDFDSPKYQEMSNDWWESCRSAIKKIYWDRTPEEYQNEIKGIADGVRARGVKVLDRDVDYVDILAINQMYEYMTRLDDRIKGFHPIRDLLHIGKILRPTGLSKDEKNYVADFYSLIPIDHCQAFIATGDATTNGQIVASQGVRCGGWWYPYYIAQRWNVIIDIVPENGNRLIMASAPGYIWSNENYYQNEKGIVILETTCSLQGLWKNTGYSMAIRTRRAIQYSDTLDQALDYLMEKNDGLWTGVYLLGDTETGEIARLDLALYNYEIWRTFNGFYWAANNAMSNRVRAEGSGLINLYGLALKIIGNSGAGYYTLKYHEAARDAKFKELGNKYYGEIDIEVLKDKIMSDSTISSKGTIDIKATDTQLMKTNSLWTFWGNAQGLVWDVSDVENILQGARDVPPAGWTLISGLPAGHDFNLPVNNVDTIPENNDVIWEYDFANDFEGRNSYYANLVYGNNIVFAAGLDGNVYALNASNGEKLWVKKVNDYGGITWINVDDDLVVVGWENQSCAMDKNTGKIVWENDEARFISSQPIFIDNKIIFGSRNGDLYAINRTHGRTIWHINLQQQKVYSSVDIIRNRVVVAADNQCYAIDAADGSIKWTFTTAGMIVSPPRVVDDTVFCGSTDTNVYVLTAEDGKLIWKNNTGWGILTTPTYSDNIAYAGSLDNHLYAFDAKNGKMLWSFAGKAAIHSAPLVYGEYVFFGCDDGWFYAVNKTDGGSVWCFAPNLTINDDIYNYITTPVVGNSVADDGKVFFSANGNIYGLDAKTVEMKKGVSEEFKFLSLPVSPLIVVSTVVLLLIIVAASVYIYRNRK